jgi:peptidyl-tRNA hydrolase
VLSEFSREEKRALEEILERSAQAVRSVIGDGIAKAMSLHN